jgi:glycosyltransferase involved in cell wall biosynthesis
MKLALITRRYPPYVGGAERVLSYLAPELAAQGAEITVVTSRPLPPRGPIPDDPVPVARLPTSSARFVGTMVYLHALWRWLDRNPVDLAYVSMLKHDAFIAVGAGRRRGFPVVLRPEGAGATGDLAWQSWGRFGGRIGARCRQADAVVAISPAIRAELLGAGYDPARIRDLANGVPIPAEPWALRPGRELHAAFVGRLAPEKGLDTLIRAWAAVRALRPGARLTLVGEGPCRPDLEALAASLGLSGAVAMPGASSDPGAILRDAGLFVLPSREEGMSIALLEAMALGIPIVASDIPGNRGLVEDGVHGRLFPADDDAALARIILDCRDHPEAAAERGSAARLRVVEHYSIAAMARAHLALFERVLREGPRRRSDG